MSANRLPTVFLPHGAGPCFFMEWEPADTWQGMEAWLRNLLPSLNVAPRALLVISAHWEEPVFTLNTQAAPGLLFDYYGFPPHTYQLTWPTPGAPELAGEVAELLGKAGFDTAFDNRRGLDHGVFIPLKLVRPEADIPVLQLSLRSDMDPQAHLELGRVLAPLREQGVLIVGSGMSFHNIPLMRANLATPAPAVEAFDRWLQNMIVLPQAERDAALADWQQAPGALLAHPDAEHLLPLHVVAGAAADSPGRTDFHQVAMGVPLAGFVFAD
jgi:aromatic ring-opening dioxygenase catalytic subunit (LigB family)